MIWLGNLSLWRGNRNRRFDCISKRWTIKNARELKSKSQGTLNHSASHLSTFYSVIRVQNTLHEIHSKSRVLSAHQFEFNILLIFWVVILKKLSKITSLLKERVGLTHFTNGDFLLCRHKRIELWAKSIKDFGNFGRHSSYASSAKILAACTRVCRRWWRNLS